MSSAKLKSVEGKSPDRKYPVELLPYVFENLGEGIIIADHKSGFLLYANSYFCRLFSYEQQEIPDLHYSQLHPDDFLEMAGKEFEKVSSVPKIIKNVPCIRKDGSVFYSDVRDSLIEFRSEFYNIAVFSDITSRLENENRLKESEERWKFALEGADDGVWDWSIKTGEVYFSPRWKAMLGYEDHEIQPAYEEWSSRVHPEDLPRCLDELGKTSRNEIPQYSIIYRMFCKDGSYKWILDRGKVVAWNSKGESLRMIGTHTDLTEKMEKEKQLLQLIEEKNLLVRILAHDLRNPFNSLIGFTEILRDQIMEKNYTELIPKVDIISGVVQNTYILLEELLFWSKSQSDNFVFQPENTDLYDLISRTIESVTESARAKNVKILVPEKGAFAVPAVPNMIKAVMRNLISNAIKFCRPGDTISIHLEPGEGFIRVTVSDTGIGMDDYRLNNLWSGKLKSEPGTSREEGTSFGLTLCRDFIQMHGGKLWAESTPGKGSDFSFDLPVIKEQVKEL
ncbi:MAG: PAS domain-containing sensor histidine kinase [Bacteroidota bacterium]